MQEPIICLNLMRQESLGIEETVALHREAGFGGFFTGFDCDVEALKRAAARQGMLYQSLHAPWGMAARMWESEGEDGERATAELIGYLERCADHEIGLMIAHTYVGFDHPPLVGEMGIERYGRAVRRAEELGVRIALENTEGEQTLFALLDAFGDSGAVGFCFDSGHEMCYNGGQDLLSRLGRHLIATHFNDNLGVSSPDGVTTWTDDLHLLPFDGIAKWERIAKSLDEIGYDGPMTFELSRVSKPGRKENDAYGAMPLADYLAEAHRRAMRLVAMRRREA